MKSLATNLVLLLCSVAVVTAGAELFLRFFPQYLPPVARMRVHWMQQPAPVGRTDPEIGYLLPANFHQHIHAGDVDFDYSTDAHGFRNPSPWPDSATIVIIGDSEVFGYGVGDDSGWTRLLENQLPGSTVINLGVPGMAPQEYFRIYRRFGVPLHPKLLIFGLFPGNDLGDERQFDAWLKAGSPGDFATWKISRGKTSGLLRRIAQHSYLFWFLRTTEQRLGRATWEERPLTFPDGSRMRFAPSFLAQEAALAKPTNPAFRSVMHSIEQSRALAEHNGTAFLVLILATKEDVYMPLRGDSVPPVRTAFVMALQANGIPFLDLTPPMQAVARQHKRLFFEVDGHPDQAGYHVIANAVLAQLRTYAATYHLHEQP
ncbi:MAG TPA: hypothetical protein VFW98_13115 [Gemmatimonadaceae bacterium]|nr:hypothetical protein [Gemmatimonadaceae bacterium]